MIPYVEVTSFAVGPFRIQAWGLAVATGILVAILLARRIVRRKRLDTAIMMDIATWAVLGALIGARLGHVFLYEIGVFLSDPLVLFRVWEGGYSSVGGMIGATAAVLLYVRRGKVPFWPYAEVAAFVLPLGQGIGRIGCALIHDHPGVASDTFLAVAYPDGGRLDHGLLLMVFGLATFVLFLLLRPLAARSHRPFYLPLYMMIYGSVRFPLDFLRIWDVPFADTRYFAMTPAQYVSLLLVLGGIVVYSKTRTVVLEPSDDRR